MTCADVAHCRNALLTLQFVAIRFTDHSQDDGSVKFSKGFSFTSSPFYSEGNAFNPQRFDFCVCAVQCTGVPGSRRDKDP